MSLLSPCRLVSRGESLKSYDVFKNNRKISVSISNGGNRTMKYKHESLSRYISEGGGFSTEVVRIEVNGNVLYSVTDSTGNHLGYFDREDEAEAVAEERVL